MKMKKLTALALAGALCMGMSTVALAAPSVGPKDAITATTENGTNVELNKNEINVDRWSEFDGWDSTNPEKASDAIKDTFEQASVDYEKRITELKQKNDPKLAGVIAEYEKQQAALNTLVESDDLIEVATLVDLSVAKEKMEYGLGKCDVCKISEEEVEFLTGEKDIEKGAAILRGKFPVKLFQVTAGAEGSYAFYKDLVVYKPSYKLGGTIETTGAGDTFCGSILNGLLDRDIDSLKKEDLENMLSFANAAAYLVTTKKGAIRSMPEPDDVWKIVHGNQ